MNLASALIKRVLELEDFDTWMNVRRHYLPSEYHALFDVVSRHSDKYHKLPSFEDLKLEIRDARTLDKVYALESIETEAEPFLLLDYLKNEYTQKEALGYMEKFIDESIAFETAEETVRHIQQIAIDLEKKVELTPAEESMQRINLFESDEELASRMTLGLNTEFDQLYNFRSIDYILMGGKRGSGKSLTCSNIANYTVNEKQKKALYFSIEMDAREVLQRSCSIDTKVPFFKVRNKNLSEPEWEKIVKWWANRYEDSEEHVKAYMQHHDFARFHTAVSRHPLVSAYVDIVYDPSLTLGRIRAEVEKRAHEGNLGVIIVDYINQVKRGYGASEDKQFDWKDQIFISKALKQLAQDFKVPVFSPYQIDKDGEARFAKGILDSADGAMVLDAHKKEDAAITFKITKMRGQNDEFEFTSAVDWNTLTIGPHSAEKPEPQLKAKFGQPKGEKKSGESVYDDMDDPPF